MKFRFGLKVADFIWNDPIYDMGCSVGFGCAMGHGAKTMQEHKVHNSFEKLAISFRGTVMIKSVCT